MNDSAAKTSALHDRHQALGAKMADFSGWLMPIEYAGGGVRREHAAVRERVGVFDVSHLGKAVVRGPGAKNFVNACLTNDLDKVGPGQAQYTMCCAEDGGVVDDLIVYVLSDEELFLIPNAANTAGVVQRLAEAAPEGIEVAGRHEDYAVLAVQGPRSGDVLAALDLPHDHGFMSFVEASWRGTPVLVCRTGYTGEKGYELVPRWDDAGALWDAVLEAAGEHDGLPCGLGARDTLRTEMGYPLHGNDLGPDITPVMARAVWAVGWDKPSFWGKEVLTEQRATKSGRLSWGLRVTGRGIPRPGCPVRTTDGTEIGTVTSGTFSPTLGGGIALALLDRGIVTAGDAVVIDVRGRDVEAEVTRPPFVEAGVRD
ncbi:glycine cleavage system aminomethyltransferase GcvT [Ornithinicoccus halotolerans]|uniref:glycine cleavage system aminomethyltransferase GcvT n=1 Tax=Ornithinicoccus halotolerans TaxID=1748220 RepID=UPI0012957E90|nr:glycine cleavage system aminomethyltransferase GcvT [Ornithinicoccus halotolerans]